MRYRDGNLKAPAGACGSSRSAAAPVSARNLRPPLLPPRGKEATAVVLGASTGLVQDAVVVAAVIANASYDTNDSLHARFPQSTDVHPDWLMQVELTHAPGVVSLRTPLRSTAQTYVPSARKSYLTEQQRQRPRWRRITRTLKRQQANEPAMVHALALQGELGFDSGAESEHHSNVVMDEQVPPEGLPVLFRDGLPLPLPSVSSCCAPQALYTYFFQDFSWAGQ